MRDVRGARSASLARLGVLALLLLAPSVQAQVEARLTPKIVGLGDVAVLEIEMDGSGGGFTTPSFEVENFRLAGGPFQSSSLQIINGVQTSSRTLSWQLQPIKVGRARIHSLRMSYAGKDYELSDQEVEVVEHSPQPRRRRPRDIFDLLSRSPVDQDPFFDRDTDRDPGFRPERSSAAPRVLLQAEADPPNPYAGQQVVFTVYLLTQVSVSLQPIEEPPEFKGFWAKAVPQPERDEVEMVIYDNEEFGRKVLLQRALFPRRVGRFDIDPIRATMIARVPDRRFGGLLPYNREIARDSNRVTIQVRDLPPAPEGFRGAVGRLSVEAELSAAEVEAGDVATLNLSLSGQGHLRGIPTPTLSDIPGVKVFPPQEESEEWFRGTTVHGRRQWSFVLVPERPGEWKIPAIEIPYFDPRAGRYVTAASPEFDLSASGATKVVQASGEAVQLHPIRTAALPAVGGRKYGAAALPWLFGLPWVLAVGLLLLRRRRPGGSRQARRRLGERLREASREPRPRQAAAQIEDAWRDFLHDRWDIPTGTPSTQWGHLLADLGIERDRARELVKLADDLHYLRYAPKLSSVEDLRDELVERSRHLVKAVG